MGTLARAHKERHLSENIKDDYEAVHGAVTEAAPKVFLKYFYATTKTGEKSGEMLATVKLG